MVKNTPNAGICSSSRLLGLMIAAAAMLPVTAFANEWQVSGDIYTGVTATDNINLQQTDLEEEFAWAVSPSLRATRDGKYVDVQFDYRLQALFFARDDDRNQAFNFLQAGLQSEVIPDLLHFDADASINQTVVNPLVASGSSVINGGGNVAETLTVNASPYILKRIGRSTVLRAGAAAGLIEFDSSQLVDSNQLSYFASLAKQDRAGLFNWSLGYNSRTVDYDLGQEIELARLNAEIGFRLGPRTEFVVSGGEDMNDFGLLPGSGIAEGSFWSVGFRGGLGNNFSYDLRVGEQFFGDSYSLEFTRTSRALETALVYSEQATTVGAQQLDVNSGLAAFGLAGRLPDGLDITGLDLPRRDPELFIRKRLDLNNTLTSGKSVVQVGIFYEDRTFIRTFLAGAQEDLLGGRVSWNWEFDNVTTISSSANYQRLNARDEISRPEDLRLSVQLRRNIFNDAYFQLVVWRNSRTAPQTGLEFEENALEIGFGKRF
ncbi:MAG: TIGR03016 family PEP-CTERM system-associated outer membrane protein [Gammaproteobacteria bacterium]